MSLVLTMSRKALLLSVFLTRPQRHKFEFLMMNALLQLSLLLQKNEYTLHSLHHKSRYIVNEDRNAGLVSSFYRCVTEWRVSHPAAMPTKHRSNIWHALRFLTFPQSLTKTLYAYPQPADSSILPNHRARCKSQTPFYTSNHHVQLA